MRKLSAIVLLYMFWTVSATTESVGRQTFNNATTCQQVKDALADAGVIVFPAKGQACKSD